MSLDAGTAGRRIERIGRGVAVAGLTLPLLLIGGLKFTELEIQALKPMMAATPWLGWLPRILGDAGASYFLGVFEITTALLLLASPWSARAGVAAGALGSVIFFTTCSLLLVMPIWEAAAGGFPALSGIGQFLIKDIALLGIALVALGENLAKVRASTGTP